LWGSEGLEVRTGMGNTEMEEQWGEMGAQLLAVHQRHQPMCGIMFSLLNTQMSLMLCVQFEPGVIGSRINVLIP
jgi:hypothetical protein